MSEIHGKPVDEQGGQVAIVQSTAASIDALYRSLGFVDCEPFENFESASVGIPGLVMFMRLPLDPA